MPKTAEKEFEIHYYDVDSRQKLSTPRLLNFFEDSAIWQSENLGMGIDYLSRNNFAWVLHQINVRIGRHPVYGERVKVRTVPIGFRKFYACRTYEVLQSNGERMASAESVWFLLDLKKKRPIKIPEPIYSGYGVTEEDATAPDQPKPSPLSRTDYRREFQVRQSDIDTNQHVNNTRYVEWAMETVPLEITAEYSLKALLILYEKEARYGAKIHTHAQIEHEKEDVRSLHRVLDDAGNELCAIEMQWEMER